MRELKKKNKSKGNAKVANIALKIIYIIIYMYSYEDIYAGSHNIYIFLAA